MTNIQQYVELSMLDNEELMQVKLDGTYDPVLIQAILDKDEDALKQLLGADSNVAIIMVPATDDEDEDEDEQQDDDHEERQSRIAV